ncbi:MAG: methyl-accepting chemotaxis protein [Myxococcota bacterium]|nr:methyl-accepting chemotaxis protein [Myxococcota bacterium]
MLVSALLIVSPALLTSLAVMLGGFPAVLNLLGIAGSIAVGINRLQGGEGGGGGASVDKFVERLADGEYGAALTEARESFQLSMDAEESITSMQTRSREQLHSAGSMRDLLEGMGMTLVNLSETLTNQASAIEEVTQTSEVSHSFFGNIRDELDGLGASAEESASSINEMVTINNEVRENIHNLSLSLQETTSAIEEMTFSSKEVANNIEELSTAAEDTAASMNQMDVSINQVETNANETSKLSETVTSDAEIGVNAIKQTIQGIDRIKESSRVAADVIGNLGQKINEIGNILNVIDDVAEQTNLLALNAAIIAAQAGEHGRGFAVVADEIKALAERTGASTKEIADLIKTIQSESRNAISVMSRGVEDVEDGVRLGHNAEDALRNIVDSAKRSTLMIQNIAQATVEQARGSKQVTNAISRIAETVQQIALATQEQAKGAEHIMQSAERIKSITQHVERSAEEQKRGGHSVTQAIETIRELVERVHEYQGQQTESQNRAGAAVRDVRDQSGRLLSASQDLSRQVADAQGHLSQMTSNMRDE